MRSETSRDAPSSPWPRWPLRKNRRSSGDNVRYSYNLPPAIHDEVNDWDRHARQRERRHFASHEGDRQALKYGVEKNDGGPYHDRRGRQQHGTEAHRARIDDRRIQRHTLLQTQLHKIHQDDGVSDDNPRAGDEADHRGGGEKGVHHAVRRQNSHQRERNRRHDDERRDERLEPSHHQRINQDEHRREREPQIAEHLVGDVPFAIPFHGVVTRRRGLHPTPYSSWRRCGSGRGYAAPGNISDGSPPSRVATYPNRRTRSAKRVALR